MIIYIHVCVKICSGCGLNYLLIKLNFNPFLTDRHPLVAELPLTTQVYQLIDSHGPEGLPNPVGGVNYWGCGLGHVICVGVVSCL